ncbi:hypothetical protein A2348_05350 [Candidatus Uhrbacteria bacterium RIFOXYB12_FULL_58_10]|nr:MAG: hypothetical protein A2348_05350 [Candidatus Uhrbacteria bacterium RIFOXYB12_FULL_58_10]OGM00049.1 MAG: hypothetical protein A2501_03815 [Candidatus Uhrbacteria bacterium RIFOXYC12_FULL_57_11]
MTRAGFSGSVAASTRFTNGGTVERAFLVRGGNAVTLRVKPIREERLYVCSRQGPEMMVRGKPDFVESGAVLWCAAAPENDGPLRARAFDGGLYDALRAIGGHVGDGYEAELARLGADPTRLREKPGRPFEIDLIRGGVEREAWALESFAAAFFDALRECHRVIRGDVTGEPDIVRLERAARFLRGVSLAPFSRRALPNAATDVDAAIAALRVSRGDDAAARLSMAARSLRMTFVRRSLEGAFAEMARHRRRKTEPDREGRARIAAAICRGRGMLFENGRPLDDGFCRAVIVPTVVPKLSAVADLLMSDGPLDVSRACRDFSVALAPL